VFEVWQCDEADDDRSWSQRENRLVSLRRVPNGVSADGAEITFPKTLQAPRVDQERT